MLERCKDCGALTDKRLRPECRLCALEGWFARDPDRWAIHAHVWTRYVSTIDDANSTENTTATSMWLPGDLDDFRLFRDGYISEQFALDVWLEISLDPAAVEAPAEMDDDA